MKMRFLGMVCLFVWSLLLAVSAQTDGQTVVVSDQPVFADPGEDVTLPCHISPRVNAVDMEVTWFRDKLKSPVHLYQNQIHQTDKQDLSYRGRTALSALQTGDLSLKLRDLRLSDSGVYTCAADDGKWYEEGKIELIVIVLGTQPSISMDSTQEGQARIACTSEDWYPEPAVLWSDRDGNDVTSLSSTRVFKDSQGFVSIRSYIPVKQQSNVFACLLRSKTPKSVRESKLHISKDFFPGVSGWQVAFSLTLALSIAAILPLVLQWIRMDRKEKQLAVNAVVHLRKELESVKREVLKSVDVTLDPRTAHPKLLLSEDWKRMRRGETWQEVPENPERFDSMHCVLGREGFTSGRHYWQLHVGGNTQWKLGVCRESAKRKGDFNMAPQEGYWIVEWMESGCKFAALTETTKTPLSLSLKPQKLGVYLDYEEGRLSFYNVDTRSHIYTFTDMEFNPNEKLYPLFWTGDKKTDLVLKSPFWTSPATVDVTLDPDTAHPKLILSHDGKQVRSREILQDLPDSSQRFDYWRCVLGREGFTSGRHYWQVQVGRNTVWRLGVCRESAKRKGKISMSPQQGYWTMCWDKYEVVFTAVTDPETPLPLSVKPWTLGVYLDYEEGQLSFYNVETRFHIYTFTAMEFSPSEKLYPLFHTEDSKTDLVLESSFRTFPPPEASVVDVTLDPDTAHPLLILSPDGKKMRPRETRQHLPDNPERFNRWLCVLGSEGFTSGSRYWQVQVGGNTQWILGACRASAQRKGEFSMSPQQGYWTVEWKSGDENEFTALTDPRTHLSKSLKPQKLGVYLDYEKRRLSFYNVETRSRIYTFTGMEFNPNEKLYPLFWTGDRNINLVLESSFSTPSSEVPGDVSLDPDTTLQDHSVLMSPRPSSP
ncbi:butyrophilin subfamily 1 member A1-like isoform X2 [Polyodon spathula]|uniref:butyrophilin subfamily 1 member A1-like isoform X2 n=1 Tax=Polyodon spathula TaxID=7913 RepID=UPI001B7EA58D|nr:butyrophilin subfamily 1 member A1-like isoform X2 [Polyodon spathula]